MHPLPVSWRVSLRAFLGVSRSVSVSGSFRVPFRFSFRVSLNGSFRDSLNGSFRDSLNISLQVIWRACNSSRHNPRVITHAQYALRYTNPCPIGATAQYALRDRFPLKMSLNQNFNNAHNA